MPSASRTVGFCHPSCSSRSSAHERISALGSWQLRLCPGRNIGWRVAVTADCVRALRSWRRPGFLKQGLSVDSVVSRKLITTDASLSGWGRIHKGHYARGLWSQKLQRSNINYLERFIVFLSPRRFLVFLNGHHVLVRTDNTTTVAYVQHHYSGLCQLAARILFPSVKHFSSQAEPMKHRHFPVCSIIEQLWFHFGRATDLFASNQNA